MCGAARKLLSGYVYVRIAVCCKDGRGKSTRHDKGVSIVPGLGIGFGLRLRREGGGVSAITAQDKA